ncbi:LysM peptidoglycan-binding domain-containing protein [Bacillus sp. NPDC094106]|uniref:LysM peptidoglycan-binding domain-containing protein n=1 Tax=Bacillus sp. NPDC094106 TaxID=3363949 RepID=UPI0037FD2A50
MDSRKNKKLLYAVGGLTSLSILMFGYQNFYIANQQDKNNTVIYLAKEDIQAKTEVNANMFTPVHVSKGGLLKGYVTDINQVKGTQLKGGLLKGEPISTQRLEPKEKGKEDKLKVKIQSEYMPDIKDNDNVKVFVLLTNKHSEKSEVQTLFTNRKVEVATVSTDATQSPKKEFYLQLTEEEVKQYYDAQSKGKIIITKMMNVDVSNINSDSGYNPNSEVAKGASNEESEKDKASVISYQVQDGDTLDKLAIKFKTDTETISKLNGNKKVLNPGDKITVPAK